MTNFLLFVITVILIVWGSCKLVAGFYGLCRTSPYVAAMLVCFGVAAFLHVGSSDYLMGEWVRPTLYWAFS